MELNEGSWDAIILGYPGRLYIQWQMSSQETEDKEESHEKVESLAGVTAMAIFVKMAPKFLEVQASVYTW